MRTHETQDGLHAWNSGQPDARSQVFVHNAASKGRGVLRMARVWHWLMAFALPAGGASAATFPECAGPVELPRAPIMRVERTNDVLVLRDGRAVHLEGIRLPHGQQDHAPPAIAEQAFQILNGMARNQKLVVTAIPPKQDRYDRVRGQVFNVDSADPWLQRALLKTGMARADIAPDRTECAAELYAAEGEARAAHLGLWALGAYAVRNPDGLSFDTGTFQIVQGTVLTAVWPQWWHCRRGGRLCSTSHALQCSQRKR